jgi:glucose-1-phosphate cytidylyltransferase
MKVLILAGGFETRLSEYTENIPKPMVKIGKKPIIWHIMSWYSKFGFNEFYIALGYKAEIVKDYFLNYKTLNSDFSIDLVKGNIEILNNINQPWKVTLVDTGLNTMTGGRVKRMKQFIGNETFMLTYGDGVSNVDLLKLKNFHESHKKMVTVTAVHPNARFGELEIKNNSVISFEEKPQTKFGWINGGFFVIEPEFFNYIATDETILERHPLETVAKKGELMCYKHHDFWHCMDAKRDKDMLEEIWQKGLNECLN